MILFVSGKLMGAVSLHLLLIQALTGKLILVLQLLVKISVERSKEGTWIVSVSRCDRNSYQEPATGADNELFSPGGLEYIINILQHTTDSFGLMI